VFYVFSRYDHLASVLTKVLNDRPVNSVDVIEDISRDVKQTKFTPHVDTILDKVDRTAEAALADVQLKLFSVEISAVLVLSLFFSGQEFIHFCGHYLVNEGSAHETSSVSSSSALYSFIAEYEFYCSYYAELLGDA
jgi:Radial spokehead-like protein